MDKKFIITGVVVAGVGVAGYLILRNLIWEVVSIKEVADGVGYEVKVGRKVVSFTSTQDPITEESVQFPLFGFTFTTSPTLKAFGYPAVELKINKRIGGDKPQTIAIEKQGQIG